MASLGELEDAVRTARAAGCTQLVLLKCTSTYPASPENTNIRTIPHLRDLFGCEVGLSDHTLGLGVSVAAVALGASVLKHFTWRADGGVDLPFRWNQRRCTTGFETERSAVPRSRALWPHRGRTKKRCGPSFDLRRSRYRIR